MCQVQSGQDSPKSITLPPRQVDAVHPCKSSFGRGICPACVATNPWNSEECGASSPGTGEARNQHTFHVLLPQKAVQPIRLEHSQAHVDAALRKAREITAMFQMLSQDELGSINMYTQVCTPDTNGIAMLSHPQEWMTCPEDSLYHRLNATFRGKDRKALAKVLCCLCLMVLLPCP